MDHTPRLSLPFIMPSQAQKHITHNEAIEALDALVQPVVENRTSTTPPAAPLAGEAYLVAPGATGLWAGHDGEIAAFQSGAWRFVDPAFGWQVFVKADQTQMVFDGTAWVPLASLGAGLPCLGVNTTADTTNRLAVAAAATLLTHAGSDHRLKLNKSGSTDTASLVYQSGFAGHAEMGLMGDNSWRLKVSADGSNWRDAIAVEAGTGVTTVAGSLRPATDNAVSLGAAGARWSGIWSVTGTIQTSDARQKTDILASDLGLQFIRQLKPARYRWADGGTRTHYGLIAQQVAEALEGRDFAGYIQADPADPASEQGLRYDEFIAPLISAIQELAEVVFDMSEIVLAETVG